jgi:hypothetical protein
MSSSWSSARSFRRIIEALPAGPVVTGAIVAGLALLLWSDPATSGHFPPCPLHALTGLHCPGCGSLRATHQLLRGNLPGALALNPLLIVSLPGLGLLLLRPGWTQRVWLPWLALAILLAYGILRNIPHAPFSLLAPH